MSKYYKTCIIHPITLAITPLFMGVESCEKSESLQTYFATFLMYALYGSKKSRKKFETFTLDNNRAIWSKSLQSFCVANVARGMLHGGNNTGSGSGKKHELSSRVTQPIHNSSHTREPHTTHTTPNMDMDNEIESIDNQSEEVVVAAAAAAASIMMGLIEQKADDEAERRMRRRSPRQSREGGPTRGLQ